MVRNKIRYSDVGFPTTKQQRMDAWKGLGFTLSTCPGAPDSDYLTPGSEEHNIMLAEVLLKEKWHKTLRILVGLGMMTLFDAICFMAWDVAMKKALAPNGERADTDELVSMLDVMVAGRFIKKEDKSYGEVWSLTLKGARYFGIRNLMKEVVFKKGEV